LDDPNLAVRLRYGRVCVFDALQMVSSGSVMQAILSARDHNADRIVCDTSKILHTAMI
jgi:hypothetical protein